MLQTVAEIEELSKAKEVKLFLEKLADSKITKEQAERVTSPERLS